MTEEVSFPKLKFRASQPLDIPRCYELEMEAYPLMPAALEKSTLQNMQHHASPFFRCALLKKSEVDKSNDVKVVIKEEETTIHSDNSMRPKRKESDGEACHHTTHSHSNELIAYIVYLILLVLTPSFTLIMLLSPKPCHVKTVNTMAGMDPLGLDQYVLVHLAKI